MVPFAAALPYLALEFKRRQTCIGEQCWETGEGSRICC